MFTRHATRSLICAVALWLPPVGGDHLAAQVDFLRGDANSDGHLSISDAHALYAFVFASPGRLDLPDCAEARDLNADGEVNMFDIAGVLEYLFGDGQAPAAPFPEAGPADALLGGCAEYGVGEPLDDPDATLEVLSADLAEVGGKRLALIVVGASHSTTIVGYSFDLRVGTNIVTGAPSTEFDRSGGFPKLFNFGRMEGDTFKHGFLSNFGALPPSESVRPIYEMWFELRDVTGGDHAVELAAGELIDTETARAIKPRLVSGVLTVPSLGRQRPGDCNGDGSLDIADGICLLGSLFGGSTSPLPCGAGSIEDTGNTVLLDSNGDGSVNVADAVSVLSYLFGAAPPPFLGTECVEMAGCPAPCR